MLWSHFVNVLKNFSSVQMNGLCSHSVSVAAVSNQQSHITDINKDTFNSFYCGKINICSYLHNMYNSNFLFD